MTGILTKSLEIIVLVVQLQSRVRFPPTIRVMSLFQGKSAQEHPSSPVDNAWFAADWRSGGGPRWLVPTCNGYGRNWDGISGRVCSARVRRGSSDRKIPDLTCWRLQRSTAAADASRFEQVWDRGSVFSKRSPLHVVAPMFTAIFTRYYRSPEQTASGTLET